MRYVILVFLLSGQIFLNAQSKADSCKIVKVLTFNILHGANTNGDFNLDVLANVIKQTDPDLVALQEVDFKTRRAKGYDLVTELAWRVKMQGLFGRAMYYDGGEYGEGLLSKYSLVGSQNIALPHYPQSEPRSALEATTVLPSVDTIVFVATHLDHQEDGRDRIAQAEKINETYASLKHPCILAGDLNAIPGSKTITMLEEFWTATYDKIHPAPTYPSHDPSIKIDYIMFYPKERWRIIDTQVIQDTLASDHCAYLVTLQLLD